jgi:Tol biopolymer transport system component
VILALEVHRPIGPKMRAHWHLLRVLSICIAASAVGAGPASAQEFGRNKVHYQTFQFTVLETTHFDIYHYADTRDAATYIGRLAERWYTHLSAVLDHTLGDRQIIVLYASHPHFAQTNLVAGRVDEGTGGLTENRRRRIAMPMSASLATTNLVLGHELVHAFQFDMTEREGRSLAALPLWFVEGMAEYFARGESDHQTAMWIRDANRTGQLPTVEDLEDPKFFPYRYGHALWMYVAKRFGEGIFAQALKSRSARGGVARLEAATGMDADTLSAEWHEAIRNASPSSDISADAPLRLLPEGRGRVNVGPSLSPNGNEIVFFSERDRVSIDAFLADARTGAIKGKLTTLATDPHFDSLQFVDSAGGWHPSEPLFALAAVRRGRPVITVFDTTKRTLVREIRLEDVDQIFSPSWSPDGHLLVFSALAEGFSDLYSYDLRTNRLKRLTADPYADLQPAWSPDGHSLAFVTDRFSTQLETLSFGPYQLALLDMTSLGVRALPTLPSAKHINPQWSSDGSSVWFLSDPDGVTNVYRLQIATGTLFQVTSVATSVTGITPLSPALSIATSAPSVAFSVYQGGKYLIARIDADSALLGESLRTAPVTNETRSTQLAATTSADSHVTFPTRRYIPRLRFQTLGQPYVMAGGGAYGVGVQAGISLSFEDVLRDQQAQLALRVGTRVDNLFARAAYVNRRSRWNWGAQLSQMPVVLIERQVPPRILDDESGISRETTLLRQIHRQISGLTMYPLNRAERFEFSGGIRQIRFQEETWTRVTSLSDGRSMDQGQTGSADRGSAVLADLTAGFVHDSAVYGPTSPILGRRYRVDVAPSLGTLPHTTVFADYRQYIMPVRPLTVAFRLQHTSRYGPAADDPRLIPLALSLQHELRGYRSRSLAAARCRAVAATRCSVVEELAGSRVTITNLEVRFPLRGLFSGQLEYGRLPMEGFVFSDAGLIGMKSDVDDAVQPSQTLLRSVGTGIRINAMGLMIFEVAAVRTFDRPGHTWDWVMNVRPGF